MRVVIFEDEHIAGEKLQLLLKAINPNIEILKIIPSIKEGVTFLADNQIDLAFFDIHLEDGLSFSLLEKGSINFPIIFTTAYDRYAIEAFKHHSIDYLLKPIQKSDLIQSLEKFSRLSQSIPSDAMKRITSLSLSEKPYNSYKERFTIKVGDRIRIIPTREIICIYSRAKGTFIFTSSGKRYLLEQSLENVLSLLDPDIFFKVNRKHIVRIDKIDSLLQFSNSRQKIVLTIPFDEEIIVAREKVKLFKRWLEGM